MLQGRAAPCVWVLITSPGQAMPATPRIEIYINTRNGRVGDLGPKGLSFVPAEHSPNGKPLLIACNGVSATTAVLQIDLTRGRTP